MKLIIKSTFWEVWFKGICFPSHYIWHFLAIYSNKMNNHEKKINTYFMLIASANVRTLGVCNEN